MSHGIWIIAKLLKLCLNILLIQRSPTVSNHTVNTDVIHQNGLAMYDTHNLYGTSKLSLLDGQHMN
jgi:hypothetical protein